MPHPAGLGELGGFDLVEAVGAQIRQSVGDEIDVLLDRHGHVREHRGAVWARDEEEVGEPLGRQAEVSGRTVPPFLQSVPADDVDRRHRARNCVEAGGEHDRVELKRFTSRTDSGVDDVTNGRSCRFTKRTWGRLNVA